MTTSAPDSAPVYYPEIPLSLARPAIIASVLAVVVLVISGFLGHIFFGVWFAAGLVLSLLNAKMVQASVGAATASDNPRKKPVVLNTAVRLGLITVAALVIAFFFRPDGLGVMFGLALCQVIVVLSTVIPVMKGLRKQS
ncbi:ATP synthase subunit I [Williamsia phyllosphaerae]|nr:ATP synthase subunit I [Williamsia phyllosphaerae]